MDFSDLFNVTNETSTSGSGTSGSGSGSEELMSSIYVGVFISICGNLLISVGLNVQKHSHNTNDLNSVSNKKNYLLRRTWWIGFAMMLFGEVGNFLAYGFAPASVIAPLGTVGLVSNAIIAPCVLKERFRKQDLLGILISIGGAIIVVVFSNSTEPLLTADEIVKALGSTKFLVYVALCTVAVGLLWWLSLKWGNKYLLISMGLVGIFGGFTVVATKAVSTLMNQDFWKMFTLWVFYLMLVVLVVTAVLQVRFLQKALQHFDSTEVIPAQFVCFTIGAIVCSGVLYDDFANMAPLNIGIFILGCSLTFIGVFVITQGRSRKRAGTLADDATTPLVDESKISEQEEDLPLITNDVTNGQDESWPKKFQHITESTVDAIVAGIRSQTAFHTHAVEISYQPQVDEEEEVGTTIFGSATEIIPLHQSKIDTREVRSNSQSFNSNMTPPHHGTNSINGTMAVPAAIQEDRTYHDTFQSSTNNDSNFEDIEDLDDDTRKLV